MGVNVIEHDRSACNGCGVCVKVCPQIVYAVAVENEPVEVAHPERCFGCLACEEDCARGALKAHRLPNGMTAADAPRPCAAIDADKVYDVIIVGAGPAGLGAAIRARTLGLSVVALERLPSHLRSHHPDGGLLFAAPDIYKVTDRAGGLHIHDLDISIPERLVLERLRDFVFMGPGGLATKSTRGKPVFPEVSKDGLVALLSDRTRELGAVIAYNTRVSRVTPRGGTVEVECDSGVVLKGKIAITAEGITGRLSERAGIPVNKRGVGWAYAAEVCLPPVKNPPDEMLFLLGRVAGSPPEAPFLSYWSAGPRHTKIATGPVQLKKPRLLDKPLTEYLEAFASGDERMSRRIGAQNVTGAQANGCRIFGRRLPGTAVGDGVIAVGDAIATCGMCTTMLAIKTGDIAAQIAARSISKNDTSAAALADFDMRVFKLSMFRGMQWMHNILVEATLKLPKEDLRSLFGMLQHLEMTKMMSATPILPLLIFFIKAFPTMRKRPDLRKYLMP